MLDVQGLAVLSCSRASLIGGVDYYFTATALAARGAVDNLRLGFLLLVGYCRVHPLKGLRLMGWPLFFLSLIHI